MDDIPQAPETSPLVRYGFATVFVGASLYDLKLGICVAGALLFAEAAYQAIMGRVPLTGWSQRTTGYLQGPAATALIVATVILSVFFITAPDSVIRLLARMR